MVSVGEDITAIIYNSLRNDINSIYGTGSGDFGYGQTTLTVPPTRTTSNLITGQDLKDLRALMADIAIHTGSTLTLPLASEFDVADIIDAVDWTQLQTARTTLIADRFNVAGGETTIELKHTTTVRTATWTGTIVELETITFTSTNAARWFFNLGGRVMFDITTGVGNGSNQDADWILILGSEMGEIFMDHTNTGHVTGSGGTVNLGFYDMNLNLQNIYTNTGNGAYTANDVLVRGLMHNLHPNSNHFEFNTKLQDDHTNVNYDQVTLDIGSVYRQRRSTNHYVAPNPIYLTTVNW